MAEHALRTDDELMVQLGRGDGACLEVLMGRYQRPLVGYLSGILGDVERARDLAQETFLRVFRHAGGYRTSSRFTTWLYHIARNVARDELRTRRRRPHLATGDERRLEEAPGSTGAIGDAVARREAVLAALSELPERDRKLLVLRDVRGHTYEEIADTLGMRLGTVKSGLSRARARFADRFSSLS